MTNLGQNIRERDSNRNPPERSPKRLPSDPPQRKHRAAQLQSPTGYCYVTEEWTPESILRLRRKESLTPAKNRTSIPVPSGD